MTTRWPILTYHAFHPPFETLEAHHAHVAQDPYLNSAGVRRYTLDQRVFSAQLEALRAAGRTTPRTWEELDAPDDRAVWLTFDDGHRSNLTLTLPALERCGFSGIFFITTDWLGRPGFMTEADLRTLAHAGMLIGAHGCSHRHFADLSEAELYAELGGSKARLEAVLGLEVPALALPGGSSHPALPRLARDLGYRHVFTSQVDLASTRHDPLRWPRVAVTVASPENFVATLARGDVSQLRRVARAAKLRTGVRNLIGNRRYDQLRTYLLK